MKISLETGDSKTNAFLQKTFGKNILNHTLELFMDSPIKQTSKYSKITRNSRKLLKKNQQKSKAIAKHRSQCRKRKQLQSITETVVSSSSYSFTSEKIKPTNKVRRKVKSLRDVLPY